MPETSPDRTGLAAFAHRVVDERNLYGALAFAETAESLNTIHTALEIGPKDRIAGVTSSGDVLLSLLAKGPEAIVGFDANPTQTALAQLKLAAMQHLDVSAYLRLMGIANTSEADRLSTFDRVSRAMPADERSALLDRRTWIGSGILNHGMTHRIIRAMVRGMSRIVDGDTLQLFLGHTGSTEEREELLNQTLTKRRVRLMLGPLLRAFAPQLKWLFFPHRICRVSDRPDQMIADFFETFRPLFVRGAKDNPVLCRSATGLIHGEWGDFLYDDDAFRRVRRGADRIAFETQELTAGLERLPEGWATKIYLSNVPDYLTPDGLEALANAIRRAAADNAKILSFSLCDEDRLGPRFGRAVGGEQHRAIRATDNVHLYPSIEVRRIHK